MRESTKRRRNRCREGLLKTNTIFLPSAPVISLTSDNIDECFLNHFLLFKYTCLHFPTTTSPATHPQVPLPILPPFGLSMGPLYMFLDSFPYFPLYLPPLSPLVTAGLFFISVSGYILHACLLC